MILLSYPERVRGPFEAGRGGASGQGYPECFERARARGRRLLLIASNSGKLAFERWSASQSGVYLAPLRLMAAEVWGRMRQAGLPCDLLTGEEHLVDPLAQHVVSTMEMMSTEAAYEVAVIEGVQMIGDPERGWAWTQAIVGVNAGLVILVGTPESEAVVRALAERMGEPLEVLGATGGAQPLPVVAPIAPHLSILNAWRDLGRSADLGALLDRFAALPEEGGLFVKADVSVMRSLVRLTEAIPLALPTQFLLCACPVDLRERTHVREWFRWVQAVSQRLPSALPLCQRFEQDTRDAETLLQAESQLRLLSAYRWMHHHLPELFPDLAAAVAVAADTHAFIANSLRLEARKASGKGGGRARARGICYQMRFGEGEE